MVGGLAFATNGRNASFATLIRPPKVLHSASFSQRFVIHGPNTCSPSKFRSVTSIEGIRNNRQKANGLRNMANPKPVKREQPGDRVCVPNRWIRGTSSVLPDEYCITG